MATLKKKFHRQQPPLRLINPKGGFNIVRKGVSHPYWHDPYHILIRVSWKKFFVLVSLGYILANAFFATAYLLDSNGIENARPGNFWDTFFFSVQTMASIGYGAMYPKTPYTNILVTIESLIGLMGLAMGTGLMFARFSLPKAKILFSNVAVKTPYNGIPTLIFRVANKRENFILEAQVTVTLIRTEITKEGQTLRRFYDLPLVRNFSPIFALTWMVMHQIDENSPFYGVTHQQMVDDDMEFLVTFTGIDETVSQTIHARHSYIADEIYCNMRFVDILSKKPDGRRCVDYSRFHEVESL